MAPCDRQRHPLRALSQSGKTETTNPIECSGVDELSSSDMQQPSDGTQEGSTTCGDNDCLFKPANEMTQSSCKHADPTHFDKHEQTFQEDKARISGSERIARKVSFSDITVREYPIIVGDNPGGNIGPALTIGWLFLDEKTLKLDDYETMRPPRRYGREMVIPSDMRMSMLKNAGYSRNEIMQQTKSVNIARAQRRRTAETMGNAAVEEFSQMLSRKALNILSLGARKRREQEFLQPFRSSNNPSAQTNGSGPSVKAIGRKDSMGSFELDEESSVVR